MDLSSNQLAIFLPVGVVIVFALLVFAFGFKSSVEPPSFKHIDSTADEKKNLKKKKVRDKKSQTNGHATVVIDVPDAKKADAPKSAKQTNKAETPKQKKLAEIEGSLEKRPEPQRSPAKKEKKAGEGKNKKNIVEKPADFDEGEWETQPSRKDKKKKKEDDPVKDILAALTPEKSSKKKASPAVKKEKVDETPLKVQVNEDDAVKEIEDISDLEVVTKIVATVPPKKEKIDIKLEEPVRPIEDVLKPEPVAIQVAAAPVAVEVADLEPADAGKKKKGKKGKASVLEDDAVVPEVEKLPPVAAPLSTEVAESLPAFNELEDTWKEAPQKKSKKKVRKD